MSLSPPCGITLTGADRRTPLDDLVRLANAGVEVAFLWSATNEGHRYPDEKYLASRVADLGPRCAVHVCGSVARELFLSGRAPWIRQAGRVQINGAVNADTLARAMRQVASSGVRVITQHTARNAALAEPEWPGHEILVDGSGGRGVSPAEWERPRTSKRVGFAGGLGPDNLEAELPRILAAAAGRPFWVDMESKLRTEAQALDAHLGLGDWFDVAKAFRCVEIFRAYAQR